MIEHLLRHPEQYSFFQAVRLLQRHAAAPQRAAPVGRDAAPGSEVVRFRTLPSLGFPGADLAGLRDRGDGPPEMLVTFLGLTGPVGALPEQFTRLVLERLRARDQTLRDFLDLFHHRLISLFYRAWEKHHLPSHFEQGQAGEPDVFSQCLLAVAGMLGEEQRGRTAVDDQAFVYYAGHFSDQRRPADSLARMLGEYFHLPIEVEQFVGQWLQLARDNRSRLPSRDSGEPAHNDLGRGLVLGERVWDVQSKFRLLVGPLDLAKFENFMPSGDGLQALMDMTRAYVGAEFDFDVQLILKAEDVPACRLGGSADGDAPSRLGWNTWLGAEKHERDASDAVFAASAG